MERLLSFVREIRLGDVRSKIRDQNSLQVRVHKAIFEPEYKELGVFKYK